MYDFGTVREENGLSSQERTRRMIQIRYRAAVDYDKKDYDKKVFDVFACVIRNVLHNFIFLSNQLFIIIS